MNEPEKVTCKHCGSDQCFKESTELDGATHNNADSYMCIDCGYTTTSLNKVGSDIIKQYEETTAQLILDLKWIDQDDLIWYPLVLNFPSIGIVFPDGKTVDKWNWVGAKAIDIPEDQQSKYPIVGTDQFYKRRIDMEAKRNFDPNSFRTACEWVGFIVNEPVA